MLEMKSKFYYCKNSVTSINLGVFISASLFEYVFFYFAVITWKTCLLLNVEQWENWPLPASLLFISWFFFPWFETLLKCLKRFLPLLHSIWNKCNDTKSERSCCRKCLLNELCHWDKSDRWVRHRGLFVKQTSIVIYKQVLRMFLTIT